MITMQGKRRKLVKTLKGRRPSYMTWFEFAGALLDGWGSSRDGEAVNVLSGTV